MWKIIKQQLDSVRIKNKTFALWMKWQFYIEFVSDRLWPYEYKFAKEDTYFSDALQDRGAKIFPLKEKRFNNTELFIENDDIVLAVGKRWTISWEEKHFMDIINLRTEKKYRIFTEEVSLVVLLEKWLLVNYNDNWVWKALVLDVEAMTEKEVNEKKYYAFFKLVYSKKTKKWFRLDFIPLNLEQDDLDEEKYKHGYFRFRSLPIDGKPIKYDREKWLVTLDNWKQIDVWEMTI